MCGLKPVFGVLCFGGGGWGLNSGVMRQLHSFWTALVLNDWPLGFMMVEETEDL